MHIVPPTEGSVQSPTPPGASLQQNDLLLSVLLTNPVEFASIIHETNLGYFNPIQGSVVLTPSQVLRVDIPNPPQFHLLIINIHVAVSSPIINFQLIKDGISVTNLSLFNSIDEPAPDIFTAVYNAGTLQFTNQSSISSPSVVWNVNTLQINTTIWNRLHSSLIRMLRDLTEPLEKGI